MFVYLFVTESPESQSSLQLLRGPPGASIPLGDEFSIDGDNTRRTQLSVKR